MFILAVVLLIISFIEPRYVNILNIYDKIMYCIIIIYLIDVIFTYLVLKNIKIIYQNYNLNLHLNVTNYVYFMILLVMSVYKLVVS